MEPHVMHYKAENLEDIAQFLDRQAENCRKTRGGAERAAGLREAADILRRTTIEMPKKPRWLVIGEFVTENSDLCRTGICENWSRKTATAQVRFGPDGPTEQVHYSKLRPADVNEIAAATGSPPGTVTSKGE